MFDLFFSFIGILLLWVPMVILIFIATISTGKFGLYSQKRIGFRARTFTMLKIRSMTESDDPSHITLENDPRITGFGKFLRHYKLDELPQLFNVLKGDMSFVGPRPLLMEYLSLYDERQKKRHDVRPGITGWAQVNGRNAISWEQKFEYDVWYVENRSFWLDIKILFMTVMKVFKSEGISQDGQATMTKFKGSSTSRRS